MIDIARCIGGHIGRERWGIIPLPLKINYVSSTWERWQKRENQGMSSMILLLKGIQDTYGLTQKILVWCIGTV